MTKPLISVVIPALNEEAHIGNCLQSLRQQRFQAVELIVVDNGSTDRTVEIAKPYADRVVVERRRGASLARQAGFALAQGQLVASTDADTVVPSDWLEQIALTFERSHNVVGVYGPVCFQPSLEHDYEHLERAFARFLQLNQYLKRPHFCGANFAVRRKTFWKAGGFRGDQDGPFYQKAEDVQLSLKLRPFGEICFLKDLVVYTSPRRINGKYLLANTRTYWEVVWLRLER